MKYDTINRKIITDIQFAPYEDFLGIGTEKGFETCLVPGAGLSNFDTFEEGINLTRKQKREQEV
jgi:U3 small nucleolar RNA-associated protein 7